MPRLQSIFRRSAPQRRRAGQRSASQRRPRFESLERRRLLAAHAIEVTNTNDSGIGSLRAAIVMANGDPGHDTITFAESVRGTIELDPANGALLITDDLTIQGPGADKLTVSGGDPANSDPLEATRVLGVLPAELLATPFQTPSLEQLETSPEVKIQMLSIDNGLAVDALGFDPQNAETAVFAFGGGLYNMGGKVHLDRVSMVGNRAANVITAGGAVANEFGGTLIVTRSHFQDNLSSGALVAVGGAITSDLGPTTDGVTTDQPVVEIDRSSFQGNRAEAAAGYIDGVGFSGAGVGGAVLNVTGVMTITRSHFEGNVAQGGAGAAPGSTTGGPAFGGAVASGDISAFGEDESKLSVSRSTFKGNSAIGGDGGAVGIDGGEARGGAISISTGSDGYFSRNSFDGNTSIGGMGGMNADGGIANGGGVATAGGAQLNLLRNEFVRNRAEGGLGQGTGASAAGRGGGLGVDQIELAGFAPGPASVESTGDRFDHNVALGAGGGIYNDGALELDRGLLSHNQAIGLPDVVIDFYPGYEFQGVALGGGISNLGTVDVVRTTFRANKAIGADGAVGPLFTTEGAATYPGLGVGGGLHNINVATIDRSQFQSNEALGGDDNQGSYAGVGNGGGVYNDGTLVVSRGTFRDNLAAGGRGNAGDIVIGGGVGGGIASGSVTALGGLRSASLTVERSQVRGNQAIGGDENLSPPGLPPALSANTGAGGGIFVYQGLAEISHTMITRNRAVGGPGGVANGGGVFFFAFIGAVEAELNHSIVAHNAAIGGSEGAGFGGGISSGSFGSPLGAGTTLTVNRSSVSHNLARGGENGDGLGGGIFNDDGSFLELVHSRVFANRAIGGTGGDGFGGGVYNLGEVEQIRSRIFANFASTDGDDFFDA